MVRTQVRAAVVDGWIEGNILYLLCGLRLSYCSWVSFMIQRFSADGNRTWPLWRAPSAPLLLLALVSTSNQTCMRRWQGRPELPSISCLREKHLGQDCLPRNARKKRSLRQICHHNTNRQRHKTYNYRAKSHYSGFVHAPKGNSNGFALYLSKDGFSKYKCCCT